MLYYFCSHILTLSSCSAGAWHGRRPSIIPSPSLLRRPILADIQCQPVGTFRHALVKGTHELPGINQRRTTARAGATARTVAARAVIPGAKARVPVKTAGAGARTTAGTTTTGARARAIARSAGTGAGTTAGATTARSGDVSVQYQCR